MCGLVGALHALHLAMQALVAVALDSGAETIGDVSFNCAALAIRNLLLLLIIEQLILIGVQSFAHLAISEQLKLSFFIDVKRSMSSGKSLTFSSPKPQ